MSKIRINELARELEVKPNVLLDLLPELGVADKKTHSSSLDDDVALALRRRLGHGGEEPSAEEPRTLHEVAVETGPVEGHAEMPGSHRESFRVQPEAPHPPAPETAAPSPRETPGQEEAAPAQ